MEMPGFTIWYDSLRHYPSAEPQLYFRMFMDRRFTRQVLSSHERINRHKAMLYFGAQYPDVTKLEFDSIPSDKVIYDPQNSTRDTVALWFDIPAEELPDTITGRITYFKHDSINNLVEAEDKLRLAWAYVESKEEREERERLEKEREKAKKNGEEWVEPEKENPFKVSIPASGEVNKDKHVDFTFDYPLMKFDTTAISFTMIPEGATEPERAEFEIVHDSINRRKFTLRADWQPNAKYELVMPEGMFENVARESNDTIKCNYTASDPTKYAIVRVKVRGTHPTARYILQLTNAQGHAQKTLANVTPGDYTFEYVTPGDIMLRVVEDMNGNGKWDTGDMVLMRQPERTEIYKNEEGVEAITTKANWEFDIDVDMDQLFAPVTMESVIQMLNDREDERLKKVYEERQKKRQEEANRQNQNNNSMGFGGMGGMGGMGGLGGSTGGRSTNTNTSMGGMNGMGGMGNMRR
jgi:hypothetical protein